MTRQFLLFLSGFILLSCIPGVVFLLCKEPDISQPYNRAVNQPSIGLATVIVAKSGQSLGQLTPLQPPLRTGKQWLQLDIHHLRQVRLVHVWMPMGQAVMDTDAQLSPTSTPGRYYISTNFTMSGLWQIDVLLRSGHDKLSFNVMVQNANK